MLRVILLSFVLSFSVSAAKITSIQILTSSELIGELRGDLKLTGFLASRKIDLPSLGQNTSYNQEIKALDVNQVKLDLEFISKGVSYRGTSLPEKTAKLSGLEIELGNSDGKFYAKERKHKDYKTKRPNIKKPVIKVNCFNTVAVERAGEKLKIDLRGLSTLADCASAVVFSPDGMESRTVYLNRRGKNRNIKQYKELDADLAIGQQYANELDREYKSKGQLFTPENNKMAAYLQNKMELIAQSADKPFGKYIQPKVRVINADILNAFALPGGHVYVFRGLLEAAESEAGVMGVLGHEWAHVTHRHGLKGVSRAYKGLILIIGGYLAFEIVRASSRDVRVRAVASILSLATLFGGQAALMGKGRYAEREADLAGAQYAYNAGYDPRGIADMFTTFSILAPRHPIFLEQLFSSHPRHEERIASNLDQSRDMYKNKEGLIFDFTTDYNNALGDLQRQPMPNQKTSIEAGNALVETMKKLNGDLVASKLFSN